MKGSLRELSMNRACFHFNRDFVLTVRGVEVWQAVLAVEHADHDPEESRKSLALVVNSLTVVRQYPAGGL
jgi:hypothetical protein